MIKSIHRYGQVLQMALVLCLMVFMASCNSTPSMHSLTRDNATTTFPISLCGDWSIAYNVNPNKPIRAHIERCNGSSSSYRVRLSTIDGDTAELEGYLEKIRGKFFISLSLSKDRWLSSGFTKAEMMFVCPLYFTFNLEPGSGGIEIRSVNIENNSQPGSFFKYAASDVHDVYTGYTSEFRSLLEGDMSVCALNEIAIMTRMPIRLDSGVKPPDQISTTTGLSVYSQWPSSLDGLPLVGTHDQELEWIPEKNDSIGDFATTPLTDCSETQCSVSEAPVGAEEIMMVFGRKKRGTREKCERYAHAAIYFSRDDGRLAVDFFVRSDNDITNVVAGTCSGIVDIKNKCIVDMSVSYKLNVDGSDVAIKYTEPRPGARMNYAWGLSMRYAKADNGSEFDVFYYMDRPPVVDWSYD